MPRLFAPSKGCMEVQAVKKSYRSTRGGFDVDHPRDRAALKKAGFSEQATRMGTTRPDLVCEDCGFVAVFRKCGRCGGRCLPVEE